MIPGSDICIPRRKTSKHSSNHVVGHNLSILLSAVTYQIAPCGVGTRAARRPTV